MSSNQDSEYFYEREAEFFGFTPFHLLDEIGNHVVNSAFDMFERVCGLESELKKLSFLGDAQRDTGLGQWTAMVESRLGRNYEMFEAYVVKNVLCLPDQFVPKHRQLSMAVNSVDDFAESEALQTQVAQLMLEQRSLMREQRQLMSEERRLAEQETLFERVELQLQTLYDSLASWGSFEETAAAVHGQIELLQGIVEATLLESRNLSVKSAVDENSQSDVSVFVNGQLPTLQQLEAKLAACQRIATLDDLQIVSQVSSQ